MRAQDGRLPQVLAVLLATAYVAALHWPNDGLWFQGDAPRHAANGLFVWDYLTSLPADPLGFALSYYARYPIITPLAYPPLFYVIEALAFGLVAPSPYVAKVLVLAFSAAIGLYTLAWARRWAGPGAGWAGACVVLLPGFVLYANAVMLNVPATAFAVAALYHLVVALETELQRHRTLFVVLTIAALLTYYAAAVVLPLSFVWMLASRRGRRSRWIWLVPAAVMTLALAIAVLLPQHWARNAPSFGRMLDWELWVFYARQIVEIAGAPWTLLGLLGLVLAIVGRSHRRVACLVAVAFPAVMACLVVLPAESGRYALPLVPLLVIGAFIGLTFAWRPEFSSWRSHGLLATAVVLIGGSAIWSTATVRVPAVSGFEQAAAYLREHGPSDTVLYSGYHDGLFGFYLRAGDPDFRQRMVLAHKLLTRFEQNRIFVWEETPFIKQAGDVAPLLQRTCGCQWIAVETVTSARLTMAERLLREALSGPAFQHVQSFPIVSDMTTQLDFYRFLLPVDPVTSVDLAFPSFSSRMFRGVQPLPSRR